MRNRVRGLAAALILCLAAAAGVGAAVAAPAPVLAPGPDSAARPALSTSDLETFVDGVIAEQYQQYHLAGTVVTVVRDGKVLLAKGYGYADLERRIPTDPYRTEIRPGSISKLFTWTAVMQLAAEGRLDLDADVNIYLKAFKVPAAYGKPVTLRSLMTHSPGFDDVARAAIATLSPSGFVPLATSLKVHMPARVRPPGVVAAYSNYGVVLAGYIVQEVSGQPFEAYVRDHVLRPLAMDGSTFVEPVPAPLKERLAEGYYLREGRLVKGPFEYIHNFGPAGSLTTTAGDMTHFMIAHLQNGRFGEAVLLPERAALEMHRRSFAHDPRVPGMALGFYEMTEGGRTLLTHKGSSTFFKSQVALLPEEQFGIFVSNNAAEGGPPAEALIRAVASRYFARPAPAPAASPHPAQALPELAGAYRSSWHVERTWEKAFLLGRDDVAVSHGPGGDLVITEDGKAKAYRRLAGDYFVNDASGEPLAVRADATGVWIFRGNPVMALYKLHWYETSRTHLWLLAGLLALFAGLTAAAGARIVRRGPRSAAGAFPTYLAVGAGLVEIGFVVALLGFLNSPAGALITYNVPPLARVLTWVPVVALAMAAAALLSALVWRRRLLRDPLLLTEVAGVALFSVSLSYWHIIGPHFP